jgi:4-amino-4-deoxy-L-arabinose transferase-like glycosyltransferase
MPLETRAGVASGDATLPPADSSPPQQRAQAAPRRYALALVVLGGALFLWRLGSHDLLPPDEPRFALVAREMAASGDYSVLSLNHRLYTDKPPLFLWAINGFAVLLGGVNEWAARLPSALGGLAALLLILRLGTRLYDARTGLIAALVFATSAQIFTRARWASIDMTLNLFVLAAILLLWRGLSRPRTAGRCNRLAWVLMGLATLAKGPVGVILPILAVLPAAMVERDWRGARRLFLPSGVFLYLAVTMAWFGRFAHRLGAGFALQVLMHQNVERYVHAWNAQHPVWFYLWRFPVGFFPWILFLPWGIAQAFAPEERERRREAVFLLTWMAAILLFFSLASGKRGVYIIPIYPAAALVVGRLLSRAWPREGEGVAEARRRLGAPVVLWGALGAFVAAALPYAAHRRAPDLVPLAAAIGALLAAGGWCAVLLRRRGRADGAILCLLGSTVTVLLISVGALMPWVNRYQNVRAFAEQVKAHLGPGVGFGATEEKREAWVFYTGRFAEELDSRSRILDFIGQPGPRCLLIEEEKLRDIRSALPADVAELLRG